ncbi:helix-turn-helix domain-containing protein [Marinitoga sp. 1155]|uniref:helix-turn-helix domain-containing protein n=1 Tax=Marinitoga sp. 1155 TaxID=1428448 RepID=UPI00064126E6|nr:helix-turn-helix transcriptional regulator [Marinitoga sp. 1155]KLO23483.1 hypothetical protein X274_06360 [Marinitoga sp. 1155]
MKSYKDLKKELLKKEGIKEIYYKKEKLFHFLNSIIQLRKEKGYSLRDLAEKTGIKYSNLSRIENRKQNISFETMWNLTSALGGELFITAKGKNVIELSDESVEKLKKLLI